ncbi:MAG TPA: hypothetical protein VD886_17855 [Herpetosiphonaceae bacterium]|nr:hypothetical protein [Herpetosiphonaceae bacterium]
MNRRGAGIALLALSVWVYIGYREQIRFDDTAKSIALLLAIAGVLYLFFSEMEKPSR